MAVDDYRKTEIDEDSSFRDEEKERLWADSQIDKEARCREINGIPPPKKPTCPKCGAPIYMMPSTNFTWWCPKCGYRHI